MNLEAQAVLRGLPALEDEDDARHRDRMYGDVHKADRASNEQLPKHEVPRLPFSTVIAAARSKAEMS